MNESATPELPDADPFDVYDREIRRLDDHFSQCSPADWARPSRCEGWETRDVLSHIMTVDLYNLACLDDDIKRMAGFDWNGYVEEQRARPTDELVDEWRERNAQVRRRWEERGIENTVATMVGAYPLRAQVFHIANEIATHADDIGVEVDAAERDARDDWRALYTRFALDEYSRPVDVAIGDDDVTVTFDGNEITLSKQAFVDATVDRLGDSAVDLPADLMRALRLVP